MALHPGKIKKHYGSFVPVPALVPKVRVGEAFLLRLNLQSRQDTGLGVFLKPRMPSLLPKA